MLKSIQKFKPFFYSDIFSTSKPSPEASFKSTIISCPPNPSTMSWARTITCVTFSGMTMPRWLRVKGCSSTCGCASKRVNASPALTLACFRLEGEYPSRQRNPPNLYLDAKP